jgi:hypothetical protein
LVDFLYNLGKRNSMIRVRTMNLQPDPSRMRLKAQIALVASYQKKQPTRSAAAAAVSKPAATTKPAPAARTNPPPRRTNAPVTRPGVTPSKPTTAKPLPATTIAATGKTNTSARK